MPPASRGLFPLRFIRYTSRISAAPLRRPLPDPKPRASVFRSERIAAAKGQDEKKQEGIEESRQEPEQARTNGKEDAPQNSFFDFIPPFARRWIWGLFFIAPPLGFIILEFPLEPLWVNGPSMAPFLNVNWSPELPPTREMILIQKVLFESRPNNFLRLPKWELQRGQIIVFYAPHDPTKLAVKRVVAIPGDRVQPLPGYPGGDDPVVVPFNHVWVEGDANSREQSVDSNWFGPISQNLVIGFVKAVLTPWYSPVAVNCDEHDYPAKNSGRIEKDVVQDAKLDPDHRSLSEAFINGTAAKELTVIRQNKEMALRMMGNPKKISKMRMMYYQAMFELEQQNPDSQEVAQGIVDELGSMFESAGLARDGSRLPPAMRQDGEQTTEQDLQQRRLKEYLGKQGNTTPPGVGNDSPNLSILGVD
ncbi:uncharacterized protein Z518_07713 [Rhinocladiella mackenziei CBS 650.93]|uniref:Mitochondrial inner membrane protease subunit 2 n=1 Tax=Rhinocladiella mackenziei CBS 650.93 TaxID=1442369 RepID=A0A0D2IEA3_9EURO|nr:uncharacterized protein Z518_07713 [Rhinocladiella mackenziei CBS 650.93]KIX04159.1 hypothetical protein Z518_07713 [Rhinocladiella mackenziei CBS 650.93]